ncbi:hypothetical protein POTOM_000557 [Populus tomentosa]|uniref:Uncharacterized protein n=1 Tax=Populus tomentosa TaxID=118781 RepID=A0A8X8DGD1_POPTO|nr:hypothetical protein POTOM_000557 [Populus tomentosa]
MTTEAESKPLLYSESLLELPSWIFSCSYPRNMGIVKGLYRITHVASQALDSAKPGGEEKKKSPNSRSFKRLSLSEARANSIS